MYVNRNSDIATDKYNYATDVGKYAKLFRIKMTEQFRSDHYNWSSVYFNVYFDAPDYTTLKSYRANAHVTGSGVEYKVRIEDLTPENADFEVIAIMDGEYTTFYATAPNVLDCDQYRGRVQFTKTNIMSYIEKLSNEKFEHDIATLLTANPTWIKYVSIMPTIIYNTELGLKIPQCFKVAGITQGYTKAFTVDFSNCTVSTNYALQFSTSLYTSGDSGAVGNLCSISLVYSSASGTVTRTKGAIVGGYNNNKAFKEFPIVIITSGKIASIYIDHREQANNSIVVHVLSQYQSNTKVNTACETTASIITDLPSGDTTTTISQFETCTITYSGTWTTATDFECKAIRRGNKVDVVLGVTGGATGTNVEVCTLPYSNANRLELLAFQNDGVNDTACKLVMPKNSAKIYIKSLATSTLVTLQFSYYIA